MIEIDVTNELLLELEVATQKVLALYKLGGSALQKDMEYIYRNDSFVLLAYDYFTYVSTGRKPRARKIPVMDIIKWMKKKGISPKGGDYNSAAFAITESIYKTGIKAKNYINPVTEVTSELASEALTEQLATDIATQIAQDLTFTLP